MISTVAVIVALVWVLILAALIVPVSFYKNTFDRVTRGKYRNDRAGLQIMLDHLRSFPDEWSISRDSASFPKTGMKQINLFHDKKTGWEYSLNSFGGNARPLNGHFEKEFVTALTDENNRRESQALLRSFYPELNGQVLLK